MQTFPVNALAEQFEVDRSTMLRAMRNVPPDLVKKGNRPTWKVATAASALEAHRRKQKGGGRSGGRDRKELVGKVEAAYAELDRQFARLESEPDIEKRRALSLEMQVGKTINTMEEIFLELNNLDEEHGFMMQIVTDKLIGLARSKLIDRLDLWDDVERIKVENALEVLAKFGQRGDQEEEAV
jgi:hypothetical protein